MLLVAKKHNGAFGNVFQDRNDLVEAIVGPFKKKFYEKWTGQLLDNNGCFLLTNVKILGG